MLVGARSFFLVRVGSESVPGIERRFALMAAKPSPRPFLSMLVQDHLRPGAWLLTIAMNAVPEPDMEDIRALAADVFAFRP